jgi:hypothetical protein
MLTILKHDITRPGSFSLELPLGAEVIGVGLATDSAPGARGHLLPCMWTLADESRSTQARHFRLLSELDHIEDAVRLRQWGAQMMMELGPPRGLTAHFLFEVIEAKSGTKAAT